MDDKEIRLVINLLRQYIEDNFTQLFLTVAYCQVYVRQQD